jgi:hypothetical protein
MDNENGVIYLGFYMDDILMIGNPTKIGIMDKNVQAEFTTNIRGRDNGYL